MSPEALMRSRYTAYALGQSGHIIVTTHPDSPHFIADKMAWKRDIEVFCDNTTFEGLEVVSSRVEGDRGWVEFVASLFQSGQQVPMREHSEFQCVDKRWLYLCALDSK